MSATGTARPTVAVLGGAVTGLAAVERFSAFVDVTLFERQSGAMGPEASADHDERGERTGEAAAWRRARRVAAAVVVASLVPGRRHDPPRTPPLAADKVAHAVGHGALAVALFDALRHRRLRWRAATLAAVLSGGSGLVLELLQRWVPGRRYEHEDVVAAAFGSVAGVVAVARLRRETRQ